MNKITKEINKSIWKIFGAYLIVVFLLLLMSGNALGQTKFCKQEICVVEFNAYWNKDNSVSWLDSLANCGVTRVLIMDKQMLEDMQKKYKIQNVPTIIVFNGIEVKRFQACLRFKIGATKKEVQEVIDEVLEK
jgi:hypothetical protein